MSIDVDLNAEEMAVLIKLAEHADKAVSMPENVFQSLESKGLLERKGLLQRSTYLTQMGKSVVDRLHQRT